MTAPLVRACPACNHLGAHFAFAAAGREHLRCNDCGTVFLAGFPARHVMHVVDAVHDEPAASEHASDGSGRALRTRALDDARAAVLRKFGCRTVLDVDCGPGQFLDAVRELGMQAEGVDAAPCDAARTRGHRIHAGGLKDLEPIDPRFDAVALWDVLAHTPDPRDILMQARKWLRPGGFLALSTASSSGVPARALGPRLALVDPSPLTCFSRRGLKLLLAAAGFDPVRWTSVSGLGREPLQQGLERHLLGASLPGRALARGLATAAQLPLRVIDRAGLGSTFEVYAVAARD